MLQGAISSSSESRESLLTRMFKAFFDFLTSHRPTHICDGGNDGICVQCQIDTARKCGD